MKGWTFLIDQTKKKLESLPNSDKLIIQRVYEKYGTLRFTLNYEDPAIEAILNEAEDISETICIRCGEKGELRTNKDWLLVLCDTCSAIR